MTFNHLRYGVLTNYINTWFFRRVPTPRGGTLEVTEAFNFSNSSVLLEAYLTVIVLVEENWFHVAPTQSPAPPRHAPAPAPPSSNPLSPYHLQENINPANLEFLQGVDRSRVGVIVKGKYLGQSVVMKIVDASKDLPGTEELDEEVRVYKALHSLQGTVLVCVIAYLEVWDMLRVLVLEDFGINLAEHERNGGNLDVVRDRCNACLASVNNAGFSHEDAKPENFLILNGDVRLIDFGQAKPSK
ncbi:hypothetical protein BDK51DRAFT_23500 [Blyttiomyces helicus]|uniref:Protein kinase domain-containing protein n=1 Tax=Blyttiomyces helicus TaxID=388810 RepID=A0A4V1IQK4_9FUNG|nr:hypothetical protein BDK51DRAFT_23500 [Blyttiomyces helicus]|eukprot:RKO86867.1 hypothetical protein BDK51DRAFT_23500 [Blyttiomyces helicus]